MNQYEGIKYGTKVRVTSGFYEGQVVTVVSWRTAHNGQCVRKDVHQLSECRGNTPIREYSVRFDDGMCRWISCDMLSDRMIRNDKLDPVLVLARKIDDLNFDNRILREKIETQEKYKPSVEPKYIAALERVYDKAAAFASNQPPSEARCYLFDALDAVRKIRP